MEQTGSGSADVDISGVFEDAASDKSSSSTLTELTSSGSDAADPKHLGSSNTPPTGQSVQGAPVSSHSSIAGVYRQQMTLDDAPAMHREPAVVRSVLSPPLPLVVFTLIKIRLATVRA